MEKNGKEHSYIAQPEADELIARQLQRLALLEIQQFCDKETRHAGWDYFQMDDDDIENQLRNTQ